MVEKRLRKITILWYEGYPIEKYDIRENIEIFNDEGNAWLELQEFLKDVFDQREEVYKDADYKPYSKVKLRIEWGGKVFDSEVSDYESEITKTVRVDVGDSPDFNPYKEWIGDYIYNENPEVYGNLDMGQDQIFSERYVKDKKEEKLLPIYKQKELLILELASTLNPIPIMELSKKLKQMALDMDKELYDGTQFEE